MTDIDYRKVANWLAGGSVGASSKHMVVCLAGLDTGRPDYFNYPLDFGDFGRCYGMLKTLPELRERLDLLREGSPVWNELVNVWSELEQAYEALVVASQAAGQAVTAFYQSQPELPSLPESHSREEETKWHQELFRYRKYLEILVKRDPTVIAAHKVLAAASDQWARVFYTALHAGNPQEQSYEKWLDNKAYGDKRRAEEALNEDARLARYRPRFLRPARATTAGKTRKRSVRNEENEWL